jgi:hypothetical protein
MKKEFRKLECLKEHSFFAVDVIKFNELIHSKLAEIYEEVIGSLSLQRQLKEFIQEILADKEIAKAAIDVDLMDAEVTAHLSEEDGSSSFRHVDSEEAKLNSRFQFLSVIAEEQSFSDADDEEFSNLDDDAIHLGSLKDPLRFRICSRLNTGVLTPVSRK